MNPQGWELLKIGVTTLAGIMSTLVGFVVLFGRRSLKRMDEDQKEVLAINQSQTAKIEALSAQFIAFSQSQSEWKSGVDQDIAIQHERMAVLLRDLNGLGKKVEKLERIYIARKP